MRRLEESLLGLGRAGRWDLCEWKSEGRFVEIRS